MNGFMALDASREGFVAVPASHEVGAVRAVEDPVHMDGGDFADDVGGEEFADLGVVG